MEAVQLVVVALMGVPAAASLVAAGRIGLLHMRCRLLARQATEGSLGRMERITHPRSRIVFFDERAPLVLFSMRSGAVSSAALALRAPTDVSGAAQGAVRRVVCKGALLYGPSGDVCPIDHIDLDDALALRQRSQTLEPVERLDLERAIAVQVDGAKEVSFTSSKIDHVHQAPLGPHTLYMCEVSIGSDTITSAGRGYGADGKGFVATRCYPTHSVLFGSEDARQQKVFRGLGATRAAAARSAVQASTARLLASHEHLLDMSLMATFAAVLPSIVICPL